LIAFTINPPQKYPPSHRLQPQFAGSTQFSARNQLIERAWLPSHFFALEEKSQFLFIEDLEPLIPRYVLQRPLTRETGKIDPENSSALFTSVSPFDHRWKSTALFHPAPDFIVIDRQLGCPVYPDSGTTWRPAGFLRVPALIAYFRARITPGCSCAART
jgi:hypothetical protein